MNWVIIGSGNGLSPIRYQAITWTSAGLLSIGLLGTNCSEIWIGILSFSLKNAFRNVVCKNGGHFVQGRWVIGIDTKIEVIVVSPTTWEAHHSPRAKPDGCGELPRSLVTPQWPKSRYQFLFYHDASKYIKSIYIRVCISRKSLLKMLQISHYGKHGLRPLSQQLP